MKSSFFRFCRYPRRPKDQLSEVAALLEPVVIDENRAVLGGAIKNFERAYDFSSQFPWDLLTWNLHLPDIQVPSQVHRTAKPGHFLLTYARVILLLVARLRFRKDA